MLIELNRQKIPSWTEPETLEYCASVARRSTFMVESGTYMGASARAMLEANPLLHLWCVDKFMVYGTEQITRMFLADWIQQGRCEIIVGDMDKAGEMLQHMAGRIDGCWCDDGHSEIDLQRDIRNALPLLKPAGELFGHDWDGDNDVARGVKSMLSENMLTFPVPRVWSWRKT